MGNGLGGVTYIVAYAGTRFNINKYINKSIRVH